MAKTKRYRRYRKYFRRYKSISSNYFRVKVEYIDRLIYVPYNPLDSGAVANGGHIIFLNRNAQAELVNKQFVGLNNIQAAYSLDASLSSIFSYYRPTGIRVEVVPEARNSNLPLTFTYNNISYNVPVYYQVLSYRAGNSTAQTLAEAKANNQSIVLNANQKTTRYWRVYGTTTAYAPTTSSFSGGFTVINEYPTGGSENDQRTRAMMVYQLQPSWTVKISVYYIYKYSKA